MLVVFLGGLEIWTDFFGVNILCIFRSSEEAMDTGFQADCPTIEAIEVEGVAAVVMFWLLRVGFSFKCSFVTNAERIFYDMFLHQCPPYVNVLYYA